MSQILILIFVIITNRIDLDAISNKCWALAQMMTLVTCRYDNSIHSAWKWINFVQLTANYTEVSQILFYLFQTTITPLVFPELNKRGQDFLILFTDGSPDCKEQEDVMRDVLKTGLYNNISFTLMPV